MPKLTLGCVLKSVSVFYPYIYYFGRWACMHKKQKPLLDVLISGFTKDLKQNISLSSREWFRFVTRFRQ